MQIRVRLKEYKFCKKEKSQKMAEKIAANQTMKLGNKKAIKTAEKKHYAQM